jgi:hypothetical protein
VRLELPDGAVVSGTAIDVDAVGRLGVDVGSNVGYFDVADVVHLR